MNPQFKIFGVERRKLKKELSLLKLFIKDFWHYHTLDKDMASIYGNTANYPMSDNDAQIMYKSKQEEILVLEEKLKEPFIN